VPRETARAETLRGVGLIVGSEKRGPSRAAGKHSPPAAVRHAGLDGGNSPSVTPQMVAGSAMPPPSISLCRTPAAAAVWRRRSAAIRGGGGGTFDKAHTDYIVQGWLGIRVVSMLDSGAEGPGSNRSRDAVR